MKAVIVGSGIGGLTVGAFLARAGYEVTVLEKHFQLGGYAHNFSRKGFTWEAAVHTVPLSEGGVVRSILTQLGVDDKVETVAHKEMYRVSCPDGEFAIPAEESEIKAYFYKTFPDESTNLDAFFTDMQELHDNMFTLFDGEKRGYHDKSPEFAMKFQGRSYQSYLDERFDGSAIKNCLGGQWPYVAITPDEGGRLFLSMLFATHFFNGSHSIKGGFAKLADALAEVITTAGGEVKLRTEVVRVEAEAKVAKRVITAKGDSFDADVVVSNIAPQLMQREILDESARSKRWLRRLDSLLPSLSSVIVYLGMKDGFSDAVKGNVNCHYDMQDQSEIFHKAKAGGLYEGDYLVLLNPTEYINKPVLTLMTFAHIDASRDWKAEKLRVAEKMLDKMEALYPGLRAQVEFVEVGSPTTFVRYTDNCEGAIYGFENTCDKFREGKLPYKMHIANLYQAGHWTVPGCGVYNVVTNGYTVAKQILDEQGVQ